ncbi:hypothetical protein BBJ28_00020022 [Nothophytophthora sp. Chile5]|nr:hypothetical protein BBJ28_00020022 [Nothophytophthora sp. Chile5]
MGLLSILKKVKEKEKEIRVLMLCVWLCLSVATDGLVWVVDSADRRRLDDCKRELTSLLTQEVGKRVGGPPQLVLYPLANSSLHFDCCLQKLAGATLLIFANKQDLPGALSSAEIADALGLRSAQFSTRHWSIVSCSAVTGEGLVDGVDWLVGDIASRIFLME